MTVSKGSKNHSSGEASSSLGRRPLLWLNVLCLDAPLVALSWQLLFAQTFTVRLRLSECAALFLTAWGIYLVDRFADSIVLPPGVDRSVRVDFCLRHQRRRIVLLLIVALIDGAIIIVALPSETIRRGLILGAVAILYLFINYFFSKLWRTLPVKEVAIGFLFAAGVVLVLWSRVGNGERSLLLTATLFGCVCSLNCMSIAVWEHELDTQQGKHSFATNRAGAGSLIKILAAVVAIACLAESVMNPPVRPLTICLGASALLLLGLHFLPAPRDERTALADLVLLTPLFPLLAEKIL
jgi:hypothetical protein